MAKKIKVILWDIDGTLLNFQMAETYAIRKCFESFGLGTCTDEMLTRYSMINRRFWERLERGELTREQVLRGRFEEFFASEGISFDQADAFNAEYQIRLGDKVFFNDDAYALVKDLKGHVKQYAVTNGTRIAQERKLKLSGLEKILDGVFISEVLGVDKPNPAFFEKVWGKIGTYDPETVAIVGDSLTSDMQGGNYAGIQCWWYNPYQKKAEIQLRIDYELHNLQELRTMLGITEGSSE